MNKNETCDEMKKILILLIIIICLSGCSLNPSELCSVEEGIAEDEIIDFTDMQIYIPRLEKGSSVIISLPTDELVLVNCGSSEDFPVVYEKLRDMDVGIIDYVILTSTELYSCGGIEKIIQNFEVCNVYISDDAENSTFYKNIKVLCEKNEVMFSKVCAGSRIYDFGKVCIDVVDSEKYFFGNEVNSLSIYVLLGNVGIFFEGECDITVQARMAAEMKNYLKSDIYVIPCPVAVMDKSKYLIEEISAKYAVIPIHSGYFPSIAVTEKLSESKILRTDINGDITFTIENDEITYNTEG